MPPDELLGLEDDPPEVAERRLWSHLELVFVPTAGTSHAIRHMLDIALAHALRRYTNDEAFLKCAYDKRTTLSPCYELTPVIEYTGLAGVGKTELVHALGRVLTPTVHVIGGDHELPLQLIRSLNAKSLKGPKQALECFLGGHVPKSNEGSAEELCRRVGFTSGTCLCVLDELQFYTLSAGATTKITRLLYALMDTWVPLVHFTNFSLGHALRRRFHQDKDRVLARSFVLRPDAPNSPAFSATLQGYLDAIPGLFRLDVATDAECIHRFTFGLKRSVVALLAIAYLLARRSGRHDVGIDDVNKAFRSPEYAEKRKDCEVLWQQVHAGRCIREDLWCPVELSEEDLSPWRTAEKEYREDEAWRAMVQAASTAEERARLGVTKDELDARVKTTAARAVKGPRTAADLKAAVAAFRTSRPIRQA